jgi:CRP/FNR family transcriptional regulator, anaerobic regulatory protein
MTGTTPKRKKRLRKPGSLSAVALFRDVPAPALHALEKVSEVRDFKAGHIFFNPGESSHLLFVLEKGAVQTFRTLGTKKLVIVELKPPAIFGEMGCIGECLYHCTAQAIQPSRIRTISRDDLDVLLKRFPSVTRYLLDLVSQRFFHVLMDLEATSFRGLIARIASLLLQRADGDRVQNMTHKHIAENLHVYRESATEALGELRKAGIIAVERKQIRIIHRGRLERASRE